MKCKCGKQAKRFCEGLCEECFFEKYTEGAKVKCTFCGEELISDGINGMCWECYKKTPNKIAENNYCKTEKLHAGWICPKCGYVWAIWVDRCSNCNVPQYEIKSTDGTNHADKTKP